MASKSVQIHYIHNESVQFLTPCKNWHILLPLAYIN
jgi:hypothetical protein